MKPVDTSILNLRPWVKPEITGVQRSQMRPRLRAYASADEALFADPLDRAALVDLNGSWQFRYFDTPEEACAFMDRDTAGAWSAVTVPGNWTLQGFDKPHYTNVQMPFPETPPNPPAANPCGLYVKQFAMPARADRRDRLVLHIGGAESVAIVWLDGQFVGLAKDTRLETDFDISDIVNHGPPSASVAPDTDISTAARPTDHELAILVVRYSDASFIEDQDQWWMAGLHRDVYIYDEPAVHPRELRLVPELSEDFQTGVVRAEIVLGGPGFEVLPGAPADAGQATAPVLVELTILDGPGDVLNNTASSSPEQGSSPAAGGVPEAAWPPLASASATLTGPPASDNHTHESPNRADRARLVTPRVAVRTWNGESPYLYTALITLRQDGTTIAVYRQRIGFRRVEITNRQLLINGQPVMIHGVNRHEHDPERGKAIERSSMIRDLELLRQNNFNAVRTAHYPNHPDWYDLCDQYGIYLWDEANVEAHHYYNDVCRDPRFTGAFVDRVQRMIQRDHNHPSVIVWSLGNESGYGPNHDAAAGVARHLDPTRPLHYEGAVRTEFGQDSYAFARGRAATDIIAPMYAPVEEISAWATHGGQDDPRPLILCEYSHAMGNSNGGLSDYYHAFRTLAGLQGGFIWDWVDQGILQMSAEGTPYHAYGGDFGDTPNDQDFCINGLIGPDREPHPAVQEFRKLSQSLEFELTVPAGPSIQAVQLTVRSLRDFTPLPASTLRWTISNNGSPAGEGSVALEAIAPGGKQSISIPWAANPDAGGAERVLTVAVSADRPTALVPAGHRYAWEQWAPDAAACGRPAGAADEGISAEAWSGPAGIRALAYEPVVPELIMGAGAAPVLRAGSTEITGPVLQLWRAPTENDLIRSMPGQEDKAAGLWKEAGLNALNAVWTQTEPRVVQARYEAGGELRAALSMRLLDPTRDGWVGLQTEVVVDQSVEDLPRLGLRFELPEGMDQLRWYGPGPEESYPDRSAGYPVGHYHSSVAGQYVPYVVPQEHGGHTKARWLSLSAGEEGGRYRTLELASGPGETMHFSALHTAPEDLDSLTHTHQIRARQTTVLLVDRIHRGIGTAACGPDTHPRWTHGPGTYRWTWHVRMGSTDERG